MVSLNCSGCVEREEERGIKICKLHYDDKHERLVINANDQGCGFFYSKLGSSFYRLQEQGTD